MRRFDFLGFDLPELAFLLRQFHQPRIHQARHREALLPQLPLRFAQRRVARGNSGGKITGSTSCSSAGRAAHQAMEQYYPPQRQSLLRLPVLSAISCPALSAPTAAAATVAASVAPSTAGVATAVDVVAALVAAPVVLTVDFGVVVAGFGVAGLGVAGLGVPGLDVVEVAGLVVVVAFAAGFAAVVLFAAAFAFSSGSSTKSRRIFCGLRSSKTLNSSPNCEVSSFVILRTVLMILASSRKAPGNRLRPQHNKRDHCNQE